MTRAISAVSVMLLILLAACGGQDQPAPQPQPQQQAQQQVQQPAEPDTAPEPAPDTMAQKEEQPEPEPEKQEPEFQSVPGDFTVQVASWATLDSARTLAEFYNKKGYEARVEQADLDSGRWYRVRIGKFDNSGDARKVAREIADKYKSDTWLVRR